MRGKLIAISCVSVLFAFILVALAGSSEIPSFKLKGKYSTSLSLLVPPNTTKDHLKTLIYEFKRAREGNYLSKMIPPTTKGGKFGDYAIVEIYVFSNPDWASSTKLQKFLNASYLNPADIKFSKEFCKNIKAYYLYSLPLKKLGGKAGKNWEIGSIGYYEYNPNYGKGICSPIYEKLF